MARKIRNSLLESRSARLKLKVRRKPYTGPSLARGISLLYRRNKTNGSWVLKASNGHGAYWTKAFAEADDYENSDGKQVLNFYQAQDRAKELARGGADAPGAAPITVSGALDDYETDLKARNAQVRNARWPRKHLTSALLNTPVPSLTMKGLRLWRDSLRDSGALTPPSINRLSNCVCAALELAAQHDPRIQNREAWEIGLAGLPDAQTARNVILSDVQVSAFVAAAYAHDGQLGLLVDTLATTGSRPSQVARLRVEDLHDHPSKPKLMMPKSGKGGGRNRAAKKVLRYSVPITARLAERLWTAAAGRAPDAPLFAQSDGRPWHLNPSQDYAKPRVRSLPPPDSVRR